MPIVQADFAKPGSPIYNALRSQALANPFDTQVKILLERRRRARRQQRWAIALCIIGSVILLALEAWKNAP